ncbi:MAG: hypothetical protein ACREPZ_00745 [Rhodanobacteraceae bacterium]
MSATARVTILMTPREKKELFAQAQRAGFDSVGAYLRRKASAPDSPDVEGLDALLIAVRESTARATASLDQTLAEFAQYKAWKQAGQVRNGRTSGKPEQPRKRA